ncbi:MULTISPECIES: KamA family radical SAM protein [Kosmotoga]|uniref:Lysine 2,3-aminomutase YodO family protein n=1 Tax=Kosmotoga olearia (strain ATCC BAA-1733 / DSM 21960 / TBF 19.5.1) TaxID=521045 RepID=C5CFE9_KOSOT|nr:MULTISPECIES: KamA family radical SAM protein [Kosmotoga]ACR80358.1 lysine 2,3-aminomutase YodO family protein [Kosmotoga olearia TBF 19.5.1]OAA19977.1 radical SAM protein [Kosmotoga sp. DU53]
MGNPKYLTRIDQISQLDKTEKEKLKKVTEKFVFRTNEYYLNLIKWDDPNDPIKRIIIPSMDELIEWGELDASNEHKYTVAPGLEHKYKDTALMLVSRVCGGICRFCFRKRVFLAGNREIMIDVEPGLEYIKKHKEITNVLLSGGDPLMLSTSKLENIISRLRKIDHVQIIRIGTKMVAFNPYRIIDDPKLIELLKKYSTPKKRIYIMTQFNHPREITDVAIEAINLLKEAGTELANQTPLIRGINDSPETLAELFRKLSFIGVPPYYVFQCRPTKGNKAYSVPIEEGYEIFRKATAMVSGLAKRARFAMSHMTGKIEVVGLDDEHIYMKYHRAAKPENYNKFLILKRNPEAYWLDDYEETLSLITV